MRITLTNLFLLVAVAALVSALVASRQREQHVLIDDISSTWEIQRAVASESEWVNKNSPPPITSVDVYKIGISICKHLENSRETTGVGGWALTTIALEQMGSLGKNSWGYVLHLEGTDFPEHLGQSIVQQVDVVVLMNGMTAFDSGSPANGVSAILATYPNLVDARPSIDERSFGGGGFF